VELVQDKLAEVEFFNTHAEADAYDVFAVEAKTKIIDAFVSLTQLPSGARIIDLGCGSGAFTAPLRERGYIASGLDIASELISIAKRKFPDIEFVQGDVESISFPSGTFDGALLSGVVHHFPTLDKFISEVHRVLKPGGKFMAFDPNRLNPFMYLYRDPSSPFYSSVGVTKNERPIIPWNAAAEFRRYGFSVSTEYLGALPYSYVASSTARYILPVYNVLDRLISWPDALKMIRPFVLTSGVRR
jgi:SAM-dependent methyltransferase